MVAVLLALHFTGVGVTAAYLVGSNWFATAMRGSKPFSNVQIALLSLGWEIYWGGVAISAAREKASKA